MAYKRPHGLMNVFSGALDLSGRIEPLTYFEDCGDHFLVTMDLPMVEKENILVDVSSYCVEISASVSHAQSRHSGNASVGSYSSALFHKAVSLPEPVDPEGARAVFRKGILAVGAPKKAEKRGLTLDNIGRGER